MTKTDTGLFSSKGAGWPLALAVLAALTLVLGVIQWMELLLAQASGQTFCSVNETFDCASVWAHPMAKAIQQYTRVPVAGWGVIWSLGACASAVAVMRARLEGRAADDAVLTARVFGFAGVATAVALFGLSMTMGTYCLTCLSTYALVIAFAFAAVKLPSKPMSASTLGGPIGRAAIFVVIGYFVVLYPGTQTPVDPERETLAAAAKAAKAGGTAKVDVKPAPQPNGHADHAGHGHEGHNHPPPAVTAPPTTALGRFLAELNPQAQHALAGALAEMKASPKPTTAQFPIRALHHGPKDAKIKLVDFSDIRCGHCAQLAFTTDELRRMLSEDAFSQESRWFPLDAECNGKLDPKMTDGSGVRCAGARAMICLEGKPTYDKAKKALFGAQRDLTSRDKVLKIAADAASMSQSDLEACMRDPKTEAALRQDIEYAWSYRLQGTPLVVLNGRKASPIGPFLYAVMLAEGDLEHPAWGRLPAAH